MGLRVIMRVVPTTERELQDEVVLLESAAPGRVEAVHPRAPWRSEEVKYCSCKKRFTARLQDTGKLAKATSTGTRKAISFRRRREC
jgi:hypothetical protein